MLPGDKPFLLRLALFHLVGIALICLFEPRGKPVPTPTPPSDPAWTVHLDPVSPDVLPGFADPAQLPRIEDKFQLGHVTDPAGHSHPLACESAEPNHWLWRDSSGQWQEIRTDWNFDLGPRP